MVRHGIGEDSVPGVFYKEMTLISFLWISMSLGTKISFGATTATVSFYKSSRKLAINKTCN